jgi:predicted transcriptional regulator
MRDMNVGIIPVVESATSKRLKGVITDRDITIRAVAEGKDVKTAKVMEAMTTEVETCNQNDSVRDVMQVMQREQVRRVPITDREGRLVGIIAQADVATEFGGDDGERDQKVADTVERISRSSGSSSGGGSQGGMQSGSQSRMLAGGSGGSGAAGRGGASQQGSQARPSQSRGGTQQGGQESSQDEQ